MSVLIKNMEMPKSCNKCTFGDGYACYATGCTVQDEDWETTRSASCPLVPVPPHGRLIDADEMVASVKRQTEIMREIAKEIDKLEPIAKSKELDNVDIVAIAETVEKGVLQEIANAPTILEAEEGK